MGYLSRMNKIELGYCIGGKLDRSTTGVGVIGKSPSVSLSDRELMAIFGSFGNGEVALQRFGIRPFPEYGGVAYINADPTQVKDRDGRRANLEFHIAFLHISTLPTQHNYLSIARGVYERLNKRKVSIIGLSKEIDQHRSGPILFDDIELDTETTDIKAIKGRGKSLQQKLQRSKATKKILVGKADCEADEFDESILEFLLTVDKLACCGGLIEYFNLVSSFPDDRSSRDKIEQWNFIGKTTYHIGTSEQQPLSNQHDLRMIDDEYSKKLSNQNELAKQSDVLGSDHKNSQISGQEQYQKKLPQIDHGSFEIESTNPMPEQSNSFGKLPQSPIQTLHKSRLALPGELLFKKAHLEETQVKIIIWICSPSGALDERTRCRFYNYLSNSSEFCEALKNAAQRWGKELPKKEKEDVRAKLRRIEEAFVV